MIFVRMIDKQTLQQINMKNYGKGKWKWNNDDEISNIQLAQNVYQTWWQKFENLHLIPKNIELKFWSTQYLQQYHT